MKLVLDKEKNVGESVKRCIKGAYAIGFGGICWSATKSCIQNVHPIVGICAELGMTLVGAAYGKVLADWVDEEFKISDRVNKALGIEMKEETAD